MKSSSMTSSSNRCSIEERKTERREVEVQPLESSLVVDHTNTIPLHPSPPKSYSVHIIVLFTLVVNYNVMGINTFKRYGEIVNKI